MSTSILYHAYGIRGVHHKSTKFSGNSIIFNAQVTDQFVRCPECGCRKAFSKGRKVRRFHMVPFARKRCFLDLTMQRLKCCECGKIWWPRLPFMVGNRRAVRSFVQFVVDLLQFATILSVARWLGVSWDMIKQIHKEKLQKQYASIPLSEVSCIGMDEFSIRKGHQYMTVFIDLRTGRILHAVEGKGIEDIKPFLKLLSKKARSLEAIAMDMHASYFLAVREVLPKVDIVFDRFHVMVLMNRSIDEIRKQQQREMDLLGRKTLKGNRFLLFSNYDSIAPDHRKRLDALLELNKPLHTAYSMKEQLRLFWDMDDPKAALCFLDAWLTDAINSGIRSLVRTAGTLAWYKITLLNYFKYKITNSKVEGINNKIKTMKRQAYGFRDSEYFKLRLYDLHNQGFSLTPRYSFAG
jgi:transposase